MGNPDQPRVVPCILIAVIVATCFHSSTQAAEVLPFEFYGLKDGLPQSQVNCVVQDRDGYIWVATWGGLARYNGETFTSFYTEQGLPSNRVQEMVETRAGTLWIATANGICVWKDRRLTALTDPLVSGVRCRSLVEDQSGNVWVGTDRGLVKTSDGRTFRQVATASFKLKEPRIYDLLAERAGVLAVTGEGLLRIGSDGNSEWIETPPVPATSLRCIAATPEDLWVGTIGYGCWVRQGTAGWTRLEPPVFSAETVYRLSLERSGTLYVATLDHGLYLKRPGAALEHWTTATGLLSNVVNCTLEDREGNLWLGIETRGLLRLSSRTITNHALAGSRDPCTFGINPGRAPETLWIGTDTGAVLYQTTVPFQTLESVSKREGLPSNLVWEVLSTPQNEDLFLTDSGLVMRRNNQKQLEACFPEIPFEPGFCVDIELDEAGRLWLAGEDPRGGLCMRDQAGQWQRWARSQDGESLTNCRRLVPRKAGGVWVATDRAVLQADASNVSRVALPSSLPTIPGIGALLEDQKGRLWVGNDSGLYRRETTGAWTDLTSDARFTNHQVFFLGEDTSGVWVGTARGAFRFFNDGNVDVLTPDIGLAGYETNMGAFEFQPSGIVWIGTVSGLSRYDSKRHQPNRVPPTVLVESVDLPSRSLAFPGALDLDWNERSVTFRIAILSYRGREKCAYRARMDRLETDWLPLRYSGELRYTNLPEGSHQLLVQARNDSGIWSEPYVLPVHVQAPFWRTSWFQILVICVLVLAGVVVYRLRTIRLERRARELESTVKERTIELTRANEELDHLARHDALTGLQNRRAVLDYLRSQVKLEPDRLLGCIIVDLDNFKRANDTLGHAKGDEILCSMAGKIKGLVREGDMVARYGGDEFLLILPSVSEPELEDIAKRLAGLSHTEESEPGWKITVTTSSGCVLVRPEGSVNETMILAAADSLLYEVKREGGHGYRYEEVGAPEVTTDG
jgi:diguanylate cyclase (GGDEF)-like protein